MCVCARARACVCDLIQLQKEVNKRRKRHQRTRKWFEGGSEERKTTPELPKEKTEDKEREREY